MIEADDKVIKKAQRKDRKAFEKLIKIYQKLVLNMCYKYMRNEQEALDMAQEVFSEVFKSLKSFKFESRLSTWLYRMTVNLCSNRLRFLKRRRFFATESLDDEEQPALEIKDSAELQDDALERKEISDSVTKCLNEFPEEDRNILILRFSQGLKYEEISKILKVPIGSVKSKLNRAKEKMTRILKRKFGGENEPSAD